MAAVNPMPYGPGNITAVLEFNPGIRDGALAGVVEANLVGFSGHVSVTSKVHQFATEKKPSRVIYITPYGSSTDFLVNIKRFLAGVKFEPLISDGADITSYVLGLLDTTSAAYALAKEQTDHALEQKRRFTIIIANDCRNLSVTIEENQGACTVM